MQCMPPPQLPCMPHPNAPHCPSSAADQPLQGFINPLLPHLLQEVQRSTQQLVCAAVRGAAEGASSGSGGGSGEFLQQLLGALASEQGSSILTLAISVACRWGEAACIVQCRQRMHRYAGSHTRSAACSSSLLLFGFWF